MLFENLIIAELFWARNQKFLRMEMLKTQNPF